jgi:hypothetical protein
MRTTTPRVSGALFVVLKAFPTPPRIIDGENHDLLRPAINLEQNRCSPFESNGAQSCAQVVALGAALGGMCEAETVSFDCFNNADRDFGTGAVGDVIIDGKKVGFG